MACSMFSLNKIPTQNLPSLRPSCVLSLLALTSVLYVKHYAFSKHGQTVIDNSNIVYGYSLTLTFPQKKLTKFEL
jgi:hypothetical protein